MADASALAGLLDRAANVFGSARTLVWEFEQDFKSQGPVVLAGEPSPLDVRDVVEDPPDGSMAVVARPRMMSMKTSEFPKVASWCQTVQQRKTGELGNELYGKSRQKASSVKTTTRK